MNTAAQMDSWCSLVEMLSAFDALIAPGSDDAKSAFDDSRTKLQKLWADRGLGGASENAVGFGGGEIVGEKSLIALSFSRMVRMQGNDRSQPWPHWMGRYWFNENGFVCSMASEDKP